MRDACSGRQLRKIDQAKEAVAAFMAVVPTNANLGLIVFDARGSREVLPLGANNRQLFLQAVAAIEADGGTPLNGSIIFGINRLVEQRAKQLNYGEFRMIVVTDGEASDGPISKCGEHSRKTGIPIYTIGLCMSGGHALMNYSITYRDASNKAQLKAALEETVAESDTAEK
jgi:Mg-chelatase subunit ChlD